MSINEILPCILRSLIAVKVFKLVVIYFEFLVAIELEKEGKTIAEKTEETNKEGIFDKLVLVFGI